MADRVCIRQSLHICVHRISILVRLCNGVMGTGLKRTVPARFKDFDTSCGESE